MISVTGDGPGNPFDNWGVIGDWRDTMPALSGTSVLRWVMDRWGGQIVQHCHFLYHEDRGK